MGVVAHWIRAHCVEGVISIEIGKRALLFYIVIQYFVLVLVYIKIRWQGTQTCYNKQIRLEVKDYVAFLGRVV